MARSTYFSHGTANEQNLLEDIIVESLKVYGTDFYYIPRILVGKDEILGEDRLSKFKDAYPIEMYLESVDGFEGQGAFIQKFGLMMEQSATLTVARRTWTNAIGRFGKTILPNRPAEGDLLYFPLTGGLFEIKFVDHQDPFYQLNKLYVYRLQVELFQYSSEKIDTGIPEIDVFESLKTFSTTDTASTHIASISITNPGSGYTVPPTIRFLSNTGDGAIAEAVIASGLVTSVHIIDRGNGYIEPPIMQFIGPATIPAEGVVTLGVNIDKPDSFGDNNKFKQEAVDILFNANNPFGDVIIGDTIQSGLLNSRKVDSMTRTADSTIISTDKVE
jgi:hypothetical protein